MADRTIPRRSKAQFLSASPAPADIREGATVTSLIPRRVIELAKSPPEADTVALLKELLVEAEAGELVGLVAVSLYSRSHGDKKYGLSCGGLARSNPQLAVGAVDVCHMLLRELALNDAGIS